MSVGVGAPTVHSGVEEPVDHRDPDPHRPTHRVGSSSTSPSPELSRLLGDARAWVAQAIVHGQGVGAVRRDLPPELLAGIAMATFVELDRWALERYGDPLTASTADTAVQMLCGMLRGRAR